MSYTNELAYVFCENYPDDKIGDQEYGHCQYGRYPGSFDREDVQNLFWGAYGEKQGEERWQEFNSDPANDSDLDMLSGCAGVISKVDHYGNRLWYGYITKIGFDTAWRDFADRVTSYDPEEEGDDDE